MTTRIPSPVALDVVSDAGALADAAADRFVTAAADAIASRGRFVVALSGGSTPRRTYQRLAAEPLAGRVAWSRVQVLWGDERCVPPTHPDSNYRMTRESLLDHVPVPVANVHRIRGEEEPDVAAAAYEKALRALLGTPAGPPRPVPGANIDLVLLGLGADGHTASLFPGSAAPAGRTRWAIPAHAEAAGAVMRRVTLTPAVINAAGEVLFLVSGAAKADILRRVIEGPRDEALPAQAIVPTHGSVRWCVDAAAAARLERRGDDGA